jgi:hypothetical protein
MQEMKIPETKLFILKTIHFVVVININTIYSLNSIHMQNTIIFRIQKDTEYDNCVFQSVLKFTLTYL